MARIKRVQGDAAALSETLANASASHTQAANVTTTKKPPRRRRGRTSSERGRAFRKRRENQEALLEQQVARLQQELHDKQFLLSVCEAKYLRSRHSVHGSLVALVAEYFRLFQFGSHRFNANALSSHDRELIRQQEAYLQSAMDPDIVVGLGVHTVSGRDAVLEQWRLRTLATPDVAIEMASPPVVIGPDENPIVQVQLRGSCSITPHFVDAICKRPVHEHVTHLLTNCIGKTMQVSMRVYLQFSRDQRINWHIVQTDYVQSFLDLGLSLRDVAELLTVTTLAHMLTNEGTVDGSDSEDKATPTAGATQ